MRQHCIQSSKTTQGLDSTCARPRAKHYTHTIFYNLYSMSRSKCVLSPFRSLGFYPLCYPAPGHGKKCSSARRGRDLSSALPGWEADPACTFVHPSPVAWPLRLALACLSRCSCGGINRAISVHSRGYLWKFTRIKHSKGKQRREMDKRLKKTMANFAKHGFHSVFCQE